MISERTIFLQNSENNKANGFYPRALSTGGLTFNLNVPRDRKGLFRPAILPNGKQRTVTDYEDFISSLLINGYSKNQIKVMRDLVERGVRRPLLIVSDDFPGLEDAICQVFPLTDHQLCFVHLQRNIRRNMRVK